jgi:hypothetical protein
LDGNFIKVIQKNLRMPAAVHIRGDYALVPELQGRVTVLNKDGSIAAQLGDNPMRSSVPTSACRRISGRTASAIHRMAHRSTRMGISS